MKKIFKCLAVAVVVMALSSPFMVTAQDATQGGTSGLKMAHPNSPGTSTELKENLVNYAKFANINAELFKTMKVHNLGADMLNHLALVEANKNTIRFHRRIKNLLAANEGCNIDLLSPYYNDPDKVWAKMSAWAYKANQDVTPQIDRLSQELSTEAENAAGPPEYANIAAAEGVIGTGEFTRRSMIVVRSNWDIGYQLLNNVYANQSKWGSKKHPFPLWEDQKYLYDAQWNLKYGTIKSILMHKHMTRTSYGDGVEECTIPSWILAIPNQGPTVADVYKYDHESYNIVKKAHDEYVSKYIKDRSGVDTSYMASVPAQLPPMPENIYVYLWNSSNDVDKHFTAYPGLPYMWTTFLNNSKMFFGRGVEDHALNYEVSNCTIKYYPSSPTGKTYSPEMTSRKIRIADYYWGGYNLNTDGEGNSLGYSTSYPITMGTTRTKFRDDSRAFHENRIQTYLDLRLLEEMLDPLAKAAEQSIKDFNIWIKGTFAEVGIVLKDGFDISNENDYRQAHNELKRLRLEHLEKAQLEMTTAVPNFSLPSIEMQYKKGTLQPELKVRYDEAMAVINALLLDTEAISRITYATAPDIDANMQDARVKRAITEESIEQFRKDDEFYEVGCPIT